MGDANGNIPGLLGLDDLDLPWIVSKQFSCCRCGHGSRLSPLFSFFRPLRFFITLLLPRRLGFCRCLILPSILRLSITRFFGSLFLLRRLGFYRCLVLPGILRLSVIRLFGGLFLPRWLWLGFRGRPILFSIVRVSFSGLVLRLDLSRLLLSFLFRSRLLRLLFRLFGWSLWFFLLFVCHIQGCK